ncbi:hypothetical protein DdX_22490 [Ditylenchus destructor]|uniref:Uncharacterized protein n=1 Tax=Ditylenchus destructor TaxID=166010 RepID=A0AAD4MDI3_9BILA|nr:hypothetical protein DdX_22490 [Ditylenchus destructor]
MTTIDIPSELDEQTSSPERKNSTKIKKKSLRSHIVIAETELRTGVTTELIANADNVTQCEPSSSSILMKTFKYIDIKVIILLTLFLIMSMKLAVGTNNALVTDPPGINLSSLKNDYYKLGSCNCGCRFFEIWCLNADIEYGEKMINAKDELLMRTEYE